MIDLSHLNEFVLQTLFKMETVASVFLSVRKWGFPIFHPSEGCVFPDTRSSVVEEAAEVPVGGDSLISSRPCASDCLLPLRSSPRCLQPCLSGRTPMGFVFFCAWTTGWSSPLWRRRPKGMSRICSQFATPLGS